MVIFSFISIKFNYESQVIDQFKQYYLQVMKQSDESESLKRKEILFLNWQCP